MQFTCLSTLHVQGAFQYIFIKYECEAKDLKNHKSQFPMKK